MNVIMTGIMALCATSGYYDSTEIATRILPNVVVLTIDPDRFVSLAFSNCALSMILCCIYYRFPFIRM